MFLKKKSLAGAFAWREKFRLIHYPPNKVVVSGVKREKNELEKAAHRKPCFLSFVPCVTL